jgi:hypothetical protein
MKKAQTINLISLVALLFIALSPPALSFALILPDTGQDLCYDLEGIICDESHMEGPNQVCDSDPYCPEEGEDFYGQDAHYTIHPPDLTDNGNGTVTDNLTGLVWEQKTVESEQGIYTFSEAVSYCDNLSLGGSDDWRVPTRREFSTLLNLGTISPALDTDYFPDYTYTAPNGVYYWTSSEYHDDPSQVWKIQISFGISEAITTQAPPYKVRCVRGDTEPEPSYTDNDNGTVTDNNTALMWEQKTADGGSRDKEWTYTWKDALAYCEDLILGGFSDWRLPNPKELDRIVDLERSDPAVDTTYFPNTKNNFYWTGTTCVGCHKFKAFAYDFSDGRLYFGKKYDKESDTYPENFTRCVRTADSSQTTTTTTAPSTSTTPTNPPCPTEEIYGEASSEASLLRGLRDTVLSTTPEGQEVIKLYYQWSPLIVAAMKEDELFKGELKALLDEVIALIQ